MTISREETSAADTPDPRRWKALFVLAVAQLMVVLDSTIVNIALPSIQTDLGMSDADRQWVVTAYTLTFGGLLLLGGRIADYAGRKRTLIIALGGFAFASALGGIANSTSTLLAARGLQGAFAALLAPAALSLISVTFTESKERARAFGVYGAISGGGAAVGLLLGGILTEFTSWHWTLGINVPIALTAMLLAIPFVRESRASGDTRYDIPGAISATLGLLLLVYAITKIESDGISGSTTLTCFGLSLVLLAVFIVIELRSSHPLLPLPLILNRSRGGAYIASFSIGLGLFAMFLFLSFFAQSVLGYAPLVAGFFILPFSIGMIFGAGIASYLLAKFGPRYVALAGFCLVTIAMAPFTQMTPTTSYVIVILPSLIVMSLGLGLILVPVSATALYGVGDHDAGIASSVLNTAQQIGGSIGVALLNTIAASTSAAFIIANNLGNSDSQALVAGFRVAFVWSTGILATATVLWAIFVRVSKSQMSGNQTSATVR